MKTDIIHIKSYTTDQKLPTGASKFFGNPDLWEGFDWPEYLDDDGDWYCMDFICQINCAELAEFDKQGLFPKTGMLYFFYPLDDTPFHLHDGSPACYYYGGDIQELDECVLQFDDGTDFGSSEQKIEFSCANECEFPRHHLLGEPTIYPFDEEACGIEDMILLFELDSFRTPDREVRFWDDGTLQFYIHPDKLQSGDVSGIQVRLNTT